MFTLQQHPAMPSEEYGEFEPGTIVLAKLKSFPPWPAIVIPNELIPEGILKSKPKSSHAEAGAPSTASSRSRRKTTARKTQESAQSDSRLWCVRFLRDDTFMWASRRDISVLTRHDIEQFLSAKKGKKLIRLAYEMALNPPDVEEFIIYGSDGKPIEINNEQDDEEFIADEASGDDDDDVSDPEDDLDSDEDDQDSDSDAAGSRKRGRKRASASPGKNGSRKKQHQHKNGHNKPKTEAVEYSSDEDWDVNEYEEGVEPLDLPEFPDPKATVSECNRIKTVIKRARLSLQNLLIDLSCDEFRQELEAAESKLISKFDSSIDQIKKLDNYTHLPLSILKGYSINKILIDFSKRCDLNELEKFDKFKQIKKTVGALLQDWFGMAVEQDPHWDLSKPEEPEEPEQAEQPEEIKQEQDAGEDDVKKEAEEA